MKFRLSSLLLVRLFLTLRSTLSTERTVIIDVSENQEWASGRDNYAHLLLAGVSGIVNVLGRSGLLFDRSITELRLTLRGDSGLWGAGNAQSLLRQWTGRLNEVFTPWNVTLNDADADADDDDDDDKEAVRSTSSRAALQCSVPHLSFCDPSFWPQFGPALRTFLRSQFPTPHRHHHIVTTTTGEEEEGSPLLPPPRRIFVVLRGGSSSALLAGRRESQDIVGLREACVTYADRRRRRRRQQQEATSFLDSSSTSSSSSPVVECGTFEAGEPLSSVVERLSGVSALVGAHGAGLSNMVFLPSGARVVEMDAAGHAAHSRPFYQHLAQSLGLHASKVWLDFPRGRRFFEPGGGGGANDEDDDGNGSGSYQRLVLPELKHCRRFRSSDGNSSSISIDDKRSESLRAARILPYTAKARITTALFDELVDGLLLDKEGVRSP
jgi:hypothetical protein